VVCGEALFAVKKKYNINVPFLLKEKIQDT
jgi:hypothetical protein